MDMGEHGLVPVRPEKMALGLARSAVGCLEMPVSYLDHIYCVDDIDLALVAAINDHGGKVLNGPMAILGGEFAVFGYGSAGRFVSAWSVRAK